MLVQQFIAVDGTSQSLFRQGTDEIVMHVIENGKLSTLSEIKPPISGGPRGLPDMTAGRSPGRVDPRSRAQRLVVIKHQAHIARDVAGLGAAA